MNIETARKENEAARERAILAEVGKELGRARDLGFGLFHSAHEGYAVILEEMDELKAEVWKNQKYREPKKLRDEAIQVAAMAVKFAASLDEALREGKEGR